MSPQLTLQVPTALPPADVASYLEHLWGEGLQHASGAPTFSLVVYEPSWLQQHLIRTGRIPGPLTGLLDPNLIEAAKAAVPDLDLPFSTAVMDQRLAWRLGQQAGSASAEDQRGQFVDGAISAHMPRRLITLAPTLEESRPLETLVAAYCPLPEEGGGGSACGDVVVLRGGREVLKQQLDLVLPLIADDLPCWVWWNSSLDEAPELLEALAPPTRRLVVDSSLGRPRRCIDLLVQRIAAGQAVNDLNWLRLRTWRESLAMVFDPPSRRNALDHVVQLDIDVEGDHPLKGLLLAAWLADRLGWELVESYAVPVDGCGSGAHEEGIGAEFRRRDGSPVQFRLMPVPVGSPKIHPGALVGLRLICAPEGRPPLCVILCSESGGCMRLEAGGMASMELEEDVVPLPNESEEEELARLLSGGHDTTNPLLAAAAPIAARLLPA
ncbi:MULTISPECIES: glucose-6-phosphate dehydrogenase assembly protein OpcA [unclassified Cyanobium]|uniref:glucose-6-phosphate dehydrogenase assembly protein OpcA n=1 Tax=unclassified Cyanobium TaxID=2627006 RepID=UPI0016467BD7|nr:MULTISPECIES: glucose-6-phosphate dehydrogenase assembly protein OpcA [unclassified Cyanobium]MBE9152775.1 glucose-6-phosphate dehydrogenase assembly protein OpcA [Cyanobium sp. LEGE 06113]MBE9153020.1 glucose-6-phosphate dehydrogenase assembly protein OpcA [Cyanobium sp. LEGE 06113]QNI71198.1 glucose 6-phosphate dehydrogenase assembly protein [Cyanobium sp. NS01]